ncbi:MAG: metal/formaldehyde-sensitive transcriptional repressor [Enhydrobacter sp.]|nr:metal/formaldehyde-sensitive transcriptional repressor [Enhydrobacter sp.]
MAHISTHNDALLARVRRIAGQVGAIERALSAGDDCATILHLVAGARGAMSGLMAELIEQHLREHVARPGLSNADRQAGADDLIDAIRRYNK